MAKKNMAPARIVTRRRTARAAAPVSTAANDASRFDPSHDEIAEAAYHRYLSRGGGPGSDFDDWVAAERDLRSRANPKSQ